jgi:plasmid stabilization system protein ParE
MGRYELSAAATRDIRQIVRHSALQWGGARAESYVAELNTALAALGDYPRMGVESGHTRPGLRQFAHARHLIFYRTIPCGVRVIRILHATQLPNLHI